MSTKKYFFSTLIVLILSLAPLKAHEWYPYDCCSDNDCHPIPCESIKEHGSNLVYNKFQFYSKMIRPSKDGQCHVCISNEGGKDDYVSVPHCIFIQQNS